MKMDSLMFRIIVLIDMQKNPDKIAIIWEGDNPNDVKKLLIRTFD